MELTIIIIASVSIITLGIINFKLLKLIKELAKLLKSDNLQEYIIDEKEIKSDVKIGQKEERFVDVTEIPDNFLNNVNINNVYDPVIGKTEKTENFN